MQLPYRHGAYCFLEELAQGGMAIVYRGTYHGSEGFTKEVAIKRLLPTWSGDPHFITMLIDEAKVLTQLQHQNIVQVYALDKDGDDYSIVMEYVAGFDLRTLMQALQRARVRLPEELAYFITMEMLQGLAFAHGQLDEQGEPLHVIHRDISPQNVLVSWQGEVKVTDFGIARWTQRNQETAGFLIKGKCAYMAPEQAEGRALDSRVDLFATGVVCYELLTGRQLFTAANDYQVLDRVRQAKLPAGWEQGLHPAIRAILRRALGRTLTDRYPTAAMFLRDLTDFVTAHRLNANQLALTTFLHDVFPAELRRFHARSKHVASLASPASNGGPRGATRYYTRIGVRPRHALLMLVLLSGLVAGDQPRPVSPVVDRVIPDATQVVLPPPLRVQPVKRARARALRPDVDERATLVATSPTRALTGRLAVDARPWGVVTIPGVVRRREAPVSIALKPGVYTVRVQRGADVVERQARVSSDQHTRCRASFGEKAQISCR